MKYLKIGIVCAIGAFSFLSLGNSYKRGNWTCEDFNRAEEKYRQDPEGWGAENFYGYCLVVAGRDKEGLALLESSRRKGDLTSSFDLAGYYRTGGTLEFSPSSADLPRAIDLFLETIDRINNHRGYPIGYTDTEEGEHTEHASHFMVVHLHFKKYVWGVNGAGRFRLNGSQESHEEGRETYPEYRDETIENLNQVIQYADNCINLPRKTYHQEHKYRQFASACRLFKNQAETLLGGLEQRRRALVNDPACYTNLNDCEEYHEVMPQIVSIISEGKRQRKAIFDN